MSEQTKQYEAPSMRVYRFSDQDQILTASGAVPPTTPTANYAANALNQMMGGINTTIE